MKYRYRPPEVEAFQMTKENRWNTRAWPAWLSNARRSTGVGTIFINPDDPNKETLCLRTDTGVEKICTGDWVICTQSGKLSRCPMLTFHSLFEEIPGPWGRP